MQDWELESVNSFLEVLYSSSAKGHREDRMCWRRGSKDGFRVKSYYRAILTQMVLLCLGRVFGNLKLLLEWLSSCGLLHWGTFLLLII